MKISVQSPLGCASSQRGRTFSARQVLVLLPPSNQSDFSSLPNHLTLPLISLLSRPQLPVVGVSSGLRRVVVGTIGEARGVACGCVTLPSSIHIILPKQICAEMGRVTQVGFDTKSTTSL
jgi:hypothetical protein